MGGWGGGGWRGREWRGVSSIMCKLATTWIALGVAALVVSSGAYGRGVECCGVVPERQGGTQPINSAHTVGVHAVFRANLEHCFTKGRDECTDKMLSPMQPTPRACVIHPTMVGYGTGWDLGHHCRQYERCKCCKKR